jgi:phosphohistidine phosphatase
MKRLVLMRHAKSSWSDVGMADVERPLNKRGTRNAGTMGRWLKQKGYVPDHALVSSAARTRETWSRLVDATGAGRADFLPELYHAGAEQLLAALRGAPDVATVLMLGHQPGIGEFAARLLARPPQDPEFGRYPTAATAVIDFDIDEWGGAGWELGSVVDFAVPRALE